MAVNVEMPLHKARELMAPYRNAMPINQPLPTLDTEPPEAPNVLVDAASLGGPSGPGQKPLVRHVLVKDLNKIGTRMKLEHPKTGIFRNKAPMGLYAIFDGQSCAGEPGPMAAEFCARNFHTKLLTRLAQLPEECDAGAVQAALVRTFDDLDQELLTNQPEILDGCGAAVCLLIGDFIFTAVLGQCIATLARTENGELKAVAMGSGQGVVEADTMRIRFAGGMVYGEGASARIRHPTGHDSAVSRSLGDRPWKELSAAKSPLIVSIPEVHSVKLGSSDENPFLVLATSTVSSVMSLQQLVDIGQDFLRQPRAACGEIATKALATRAGSAQCTAVKVAFLPPHTTGDNKRRAPGTAGPEPAPAYQVAKKAKVTNARGGTTQSMRLRHMLVRFQDAPGKDGKKPLRNRQEAETLLRDALTQLRAEVRALKKAPKDATELVTTTTKKFAELCRKLSECDSAKKGGAMIGDLGWLSPEELANFGGSFKEVMEVLEPGQFSDITLSDSGLHIAQRVA